MQDMCEDSDEPPKGIVQLLMTAESKTPICVALRNAVAGENEAHENPFLDLRL
jgi:hypothetical protein